MAKIVYLALCIFCGGMEVMVQRPQVAGATIIHSETDGVCGDSRFVDDLSQVSIQIGRETLIKHDMMQPLHENPLILIAKSI
uniref:Secreted protein n=1 Tax=Setaria digitata TaxID=48799 RepID=A0A915Q3M9_9BILA